MELNKYYDCTLHKRVRRKHRVYNPKIRYKKRPFTFIGKDAFMYKFQYCPAMALPFGLYHATLYTEMRSHKRFPCWSSVGGIKNVAVIKPRIYSFG